MVIVGTVTIKDVEKQIVDALKFAVKDYEASPVDRHDAAEILKRIRHGRLDLTDMAWLSMPSLSGEILH